MNSKKANLTLKAFDNLVCENSEHPDLVIMGFSLDKIIQENGLYFNSFEKIKEILFVRADHKIAISEAEYKNGRDNV